MSLGNEDDHTIPQQGNSANDDDDNGGTAEPTTTTPHVAGDLPSNVNPPSTRTSLTRVEHDEEARPRQGDLVASLVGTTTATTTTGPLAREENPNTSLQPSPVHEEERTVSAQPTPDPSDREPVVVQQQQQAGEPAADTVPLTPQTYVTFLVISGKRRTLAFEPSTTIGRVKELAWNSWPADWQDERPPAPSYLRVLYLGRMLQDDETLEKLKLPVSSSNSPVSTIMHLSVRPYALPGQGDGLKKKKRRGRSDTSGSNEGDQDSDNAGCCKCIIC